MTSKKNKDEPINLIGCDTIVNSPSYYYYYQKVMHEGSFLKRDFLWWEKSGQMSPPRLCMRADFQEGFMLVGKVWPNVTTKAVYDGSFARGICVGGKSRAK